jgi:hypothetical protein
MKQAFKIMPLFFVGSCFLLGCNKKTEPTNCTGSACEGTHTYYLDTNYTALVITKDTTYQFVDATNDTIKLIRNSTYTKWNHHVGGCDCPGQSTDLSSECLFGVYVLKGMNIALQYEESTSYPNKIWFDVLFSNKSG